MSELSEHFYNKSGGTIFKQSTSVTDDGWSGGGDVIAEPPSGKRLVITNITIQPSAAGVATTIKSYRSDGATVIETLFDQVLVSGFLLSIPVIDMSDAPLILNPYGSETDGRQLQAIVSSGSAYVTVRGFVL